MLKGFVIVLVFLAVLIAAIQFIERNDTRITISVLSKTFQDIKAGYALICAAFLGALGAAGAILLLLGRSELTNFRLRRNVLRLEKELISLRNLPITEGSSESDSETQISESSLP